SSIKADSSPSLWLVCRTSCCYVEVKGHTGQDITLPCKYDRKYYGALSVCWQRGEIPTRGCSNQLISTDGLTVETRASSRYQLLGRLEDGDVSLTIKSLTEGDAGRYGCRVEIPGWFNDDKHHIDVSVVTGEDPVGCLCTKCTEAVNLKTNIPSYQGKVFLSRAVGSLRDRQTCSDHDRPKPASSLRLCQSVFSLSSYGRFRKMMTSKMTFSISGGSITP
uniref:Ig-like domain-containing protein n=1 Tax=Oreochromis aureus TaxID=47969 RepID=A0A668TQY3_OREAU